MQINSLTTSQGGNEGGSFSRSMDDESKVHGGCPDPALTAKGFTEYTASRHLRIALLTLIAAIAGCAPQESSAPPPSATTKPATSSGSSCVVDANAICQQF